MANDFPDSAPARFLQASEVEGVPWTLPGLLGGFDFDPTLYDAVEVEPCSIWTDENGERSTERTRFSDVPAAPVVMWSVYLHLVPVDGSGGADCVADLSNECAALCLAAALCSQYGFDPGADSKVESILLASNAPRYVIEPQRDLLRLVCRNEASGDETQFAACPEAEAEIWAVMRYEPGAERGDAEPVEDCPTRAAAVAFINGERSGQ